MRTDIQIDAIMSAWTSEYSEAALAEGWDLFTTSDADSEVQVQRVDDSDELPYGAPYLAGDNVAMLIVRNGTGAHHVMARKIISEHFPAEWASIEKCIAEEGK